jgi:hypothetical protein
MLKYYLVLLLILGAVLVYIFRGDPCNRLVRADFSNMYPDFEILDSGAQEGTPDSVHCHIYYKKSGSDQIYDDTWLYKNPGNGWEFSKILGTREREQGS